MHHESESGPRPEREPDDEVHILGKKIESFWPFLDGLTVAKHHIYGDLAHHKDELSQALGNYLFDLPGSRVSERKTTAAEQFFAKIWREFLEINGSLNTLQDIEIYVGRFPYSKTSITRPRHLRYHIESYLNEVYILKARLLAFLTMVGRLYRKDQRHPDILRRTKPLFQIVSDTLESVTNVRGSHVHQARFHSQDLDRLESLDLLAGTGNDEVAESLRPYYDHEYRKIRRSWKMTLKNNNAAIIKLLDIYSESLLLVIFNESGSELRYPQSYRT